MKSNQSPPVSDLELDQADLINLALRAFHRAEQSNPRLEAHLDLAGHLVRLQFAGSALPSRILPALAHRQVPPGDRPDLTISLWDNASTGSRLPVLLESFLRSIKANPWESLDTRHGVRGMNDTRIQTVFRLGPVDILSVFDRAQARAVYWMEDGALLPYWERGSPLQTILNWWAESQSMQYVHAAAVGTFSGAVLMVGAGGSGKSTAALACLDSPLAYVADDYCLVRVDPEPRVFSLYNTAKLIGPEDLARFPGLGGTIVNPDRGPTDKALLSLYPEIASAPEGRGDNPVKGSSAGRASRLLDQAPLRAVLLPSVTGQAPTRLTAVSRAEALRALAPSTVFQLPGTNQSALSRMSQLVRRLPCYRLEMGPDITTVPPILVELLESL